MKIDSNGVEESEEDQLLCFMQLLASNAKTSDMSLGVDLSLFKDR